MNVQGLAWKKLLNIFLLPSRRSSGIERLLGAYEGQVWEGQVCFVDKF